MVPLWPRVTSSPKAQLPALAMGMMSEKAVEQVVADVAAAGTSA
jgi:hypothetical protein